MNFIPDFKKIVSFPNNNRSEQNKNVLWNGFFAQFDLLKVIQNLLIAGVVFLFCLIVSKLAFNRPNTVGGKEKNTAEESNLVATWNPDEAKPFETYQTLLNERDLFAKFQDKLAPVEPQVVVEQAQPQVNILSTLQLIGVWVDEIPQAVLLDTQSQESFFLIKGDKYKDATVEDIQEGKVTFNYQNQKIDILQQ